MFCVALPALAFSSQDNIMRPLSICICHCVKVVFDLITLHDKKLKKIKLFQLTWI